MSYRDALSYNDDADENANANDAEGNDALASVACPTILVNVNQAPSYAACRANGGVAFDSAKSEFLSVVTEGVFSTYWEWVQSLGYKIKIVGGAGPTDPMDGSNARPSTNDVRCGEGKTFFFRYDGKGGTFNDAVTSRSFVEDSMKWFAGVRVFMKPAVSSVHWPDSKAFNLSGDTSIVGEGNFTDAWAKCDADGEDALEPTEECLQNLADSEGGHLHFKFKMGESGEDPWWLNLPVAKPVLVGVSGEPVVFPQPKILPKYGEAATWLDVTLALGLFFFFLLGVLAVARKVKLIKYNGKIPLVDWLAGNGGGGGGWNALEDGEYVRVENGEDYRGEEDVEGSQYSDSDEEIDDEHDDEMFVDMPDLQGGSPIPIPFHKRRRRMSTEEEE